MWTDIQYVLTLFSVHEGRTVHILLRYFPSIRYVTFTRGRKQYTHITKHPKKDVNLNNNFKALWVGVKVANAKNNCCYN